MTIFIGTNIAGGKNNYVITEFFNKKSFYNYVAELLACSENQPRGYENISDLCELMADCGPGSGSRWHCRVSYETAKGSV